MKAAHNNAEATRYRRLTADVIAIIAIVLMSMLATHMAGWTAWALLGAAGVVAALIFLGVITAQAHFAVMFGVIGTLTVVLAAIIKPVR